ncbi:prosaposin [Drosophila grimshawi]|uniref:GH14090 n=1 Tax=Drosophila grimshawi TaxID=7222 RepID=B4JY38_DROGR|nr:prosaposin [Drosophila grimshawi]EDV90600.1 GH14090 [Drosophila grimshawi]
MRNAGLLAILALFVCAVGVSSTPVAEQVALLGSAKCTWGPSYWCENLSNSKDCRATRHCIQTVWEKRIVPVDTDSICDICKKMVDEAREQLRSNQTEEELKEVLEGSCKLIPIKLIQKECITLADNFIPELVEALSSQMNPDQVCSVAGLCNSARIDELRMHGFQATLNGTLKEEDVDMESGVVAKKPEEKKEIDLKQLSCGNCNLLARLMQHKFASTNRDNMVEQLLHVCGTMSSFSDACASLVLTYFNDLYEHLEQHLQTNGLCHLSGVCAARYHQHEDDPKEEETEELATFDGVDDDIPCALCEQLVKHLRDVLVANTTETEFKQVLEGFCKQSRGFKDECISIVDQYYHVIYSTLVNNLDANGTCFLIGVCPKGNSVIYDAPIVPLVPVVAPAEVQISIKRLGANEPKFTQQQIMDMQLPFDSLMGAANRLQLVNEGSLCTVCEYLLHFIQETLATPATDDEIKHTVENICTKMPHGVAAQCRNFVEMYGDAVIALLIQGLNPRSVCPMMQMCPRNLELSEDIEVFQPETTVHNSSPNDEQDKPTCPLCLFAVEQAQIKIRDNKSKDNIKRVLDDLCSHLPNKLRSECVDFVDTYSNELIDMLITDFKPEEICVQLKLCPKTKNYLDDLGLSLSESSDENEIFGSNEELPIELSFDKDFSLSPNCLLCEEVVKQVEKRIGKHATKAEIKDALAHSCDKLRKPLAHKCHMFIDKHGDQIADLFLKQMSPKLICAELGACIIGGGEQEDLDIDEALKYDVVVLANPQDDDKLARLESSSSVEEPPTCVLCEFVMTKLEADLQNKTEQDEIKKAIRNVCNHLPATIRKQCDTFVDSYATAIISLLSKVPPKEVCQKMQLCFSSVVSDEVIECGVCHGISQALLPFFRSQKQHDQLTSQDMIGHACENLPAKYYNICSEMISIYGISIMHLAERPYIDQSHVCSEIGKCFDSEKSALAFARISA